jgi:trehalose 6-phosphate phosphatase
LSPPLPPPSADFAWFFDVDGTVAEIAETPDAVIVHSDTARVLARLHARSHGALALVSGRPIADIDRLLPGTRYPAAGQHGFERRSADGNVTLFGARSPALADAQAAVTAFVERHPGLRLELKGHSLAVHYRQAPRLAAHVHRTMRTLRDSLGESFKLQAGKRVLELLPVGTDKGTAVEAFLREPPFAGRVPVFVGDDLTDEHAFAIVNARGGYSVKVGRGPTAARFRLPDVEAVRSWIDRDPR